MFKFKYVCIISLLASTFVFVNSALDIFRDFRLIGSEPLWAGANTGDDWHALSNNNVIRIEIFWNIFTYLEFIDKYLIVMP